MIENWTPDIAPAMISDDIAFVGGRPVSVHCLLSDEGLILVDAGYPGMLEGIRQNLAVLGLDLRDVCAVVHTHGHVDHFGCTAEIVRLTGAKTYIGREDADIMAGERDLSWAKELGIPRPEPVKADVQFGDGDVLRIGGRTIRLVHAPGHTEGTYALLVDTRVNGAPRIAAMHGGVGINSMRRAFLEEYGLPLRLRDQFREGLHALAKERVDIVLGNHPDQNDTEGKIARLGSGANPFVDPGEWRRFLQACERQLDEMLKEEE